MPALLSLGRAALLVLLALVSATASAQFTEPCEDEAFQGDDARTSLPARAFGKAPFRLVYDHVTASTTLLDARGEAVEVWEKADGPPFAEVPTDRPVVVEVRNANALVYAYPVTAVVSEPLAAPRTCGGQGRQFVLASGLLVGGSLSPGANVGLGEGGSFTDFLNVDLAGVGTLLGRRSEGGYPSAELADVVQQSRSTVSALRAAAQALTAARNETAADLVRAARLGDTQPIDPLLADIQSDLERVRPGMSDPARVPLAAGEMVPASGASLTALFAAAEAVEAGDVDDPMSSAARGVVELAAVAKAAAAEADAATEAIQLLALRVATARENVTQRTTLKPGDDLREVAIQIEEADDAVEGVLPTRAGTTVSAFLGPASGGGFGCAVAVSLTFAPPTPEYGFLDGALVDNAEEGLGAAPAVLFEVAPPGIGSVLGLVGGVGLGANFAPNLYAGGSFRLFRPVLLTGGVVWRRTYGLPEGFALGGTLDDDLSEAAFLDALPREWSRTFFVGLSVTP